MPRGSRSACDLQVVASGPDDEEHVGAATRRRSRPLTAVIGEEQGEVVDGGCTRGGPHLQRPVSRCEVDDLEVMSLFVGIRHHDEPLGPPDVHDACVLFLDCLRVVDSSGHFHLRPGLAGRHLSHGLPAFSRAMHRHPSLAGHVVATAKDADLERQRLAGLKEHQREGQQAQAWHGGIFMDRSSHLEASEIGSLDRDPARTTSVSSGGS